MGSMDDENDSPLAAKGGALNVEVRNDTAANQISTCEFGM